MAVTINGNGGIGGVSLGYRNLIINGSFMANQRGYASGTATTVANQYTLDRWRVVTSGQNLAFSTSAGKTTVTAPAGGIEQVIEGTYLQSGTYVINWEGTATCTVDGVARAKGDSFAVTGGDNLTIKFSSGTVANVQLEQGPVATPFEQRPYGLELSLCQRYYEVGRFFFVSGYISLGGNCGSSVKFCVNKRAIPTVTATNVNVTGNLSPTVGISDIQVDSVLLYHANTADASAGQFIDNWVASAEL